MPSLVQKSWTLMALSCRGLCGSQPSRGLQSSRQDDREGRQEAGSPGGGVGGIFQSGFN